MGMLALSTSAESGLVLGHVHHLVGALAAVRRAKPPHLLEVRAVRGQRSRFDADPIDAAVALLELAREALRDRDLVQRLEDRLADLPWYGLEAYADESAISSSLTTSTTRRRFRRLTPTT